ncbi:MAG: hypothetical protein NVV74_26175 [Magnetospirillum sp.]|nr:hypothetical protein [Magnetospirillum sp.]
MTAAQATPHRSHRRRTLRRTVYHMLGGEGHEDPVVKAVDWFLIGLIVLNVVAVVLESIEHLSIAHGPVFHAFDLFSVAVFSLEYLLRLWTAVEPGGRALPPPPVGTVALGGLGHGHHRPVVGAAVLPGHVRRAWTCAPSGCCACCGCSSWAVIPWP